MSSHNFVKEDQEPPLLIAEPVRFESIQTLLEWVPSIIVLEPAFEQAMLWGIKADMIIGSPQFIQAIHEKIAHQLPVEIVVSPSATEAFSTAIELLASKKQNAVNVCVNNLDAYFTQADQYRQRLDICLYDGVTRWSCIASGTFTKWMPEGSKVRVRCDTPFHVVGAVKVNGVEISVINDSLVSIQADSFYWIGEPIK